MNVIVSSRLSAAPHFGQRLRLRLTRGSSGAPRAAQIGQRALYAHCAQISTGSSTNTKPRAHQARGFGGYCRYAGVRSRCDPQFFYDIEEYVSVSFTFEMLTVKYTRR